MQQYDFTATANKPFYIGAAGRYIKYVSGSNGGGDASLLITPGGMGGNKITLQPGQAYRIADDVKVPDSWTLLNAAGGAPILGRIVVGNGRIDDPTIAGTVQVIDGGKARTLAGIAFMANLYQGQVASQYSAVQLWNQVPSGKRQVVESIALNATSAGAAQFWINNAYLTTIGGGAVNKLAGGALSAALMCSQTAGATWAPPASGYMGSAFLQANQLQTFTLKEPLVILPGYGLIIATQASNAALQAVVEFYEEPNV